MVTGMVDIDIDIDIDVDVDVVFIFIFKAILELVRDWIKGEILGGVMV